MRKSTNLHPAPAVSSPVIITHLRSKRPLPLRISIRQSAIGADLYSPVQRPEHPAYFHRGVLSTVLWYGIRFSLPSAAHPISPERFHGADNYPAQAPSA